MDTLTTKRVHPRPKGGEFMRILVISVLVFCALLIGWFISVEYNRSTSIKNRPPLPTPGESGSPSTQAKPDTQTLEKTPRVETDKKGIVGSSAEHAHDGHQTELLHTHDTESQVDGADTQKSSAPPYNSGNDSHADNDQMPEPHTPFEALREKLIEEHGDIPLVHTYIELRKKEHNKEPMTMDEVSTLWDAIMVFNPTPANKRSYELIKRLSSQADPGNFRVIYDQQEIQRLKRDGGREHP